MSTIDQSRLLQMRSSILNPNQALQRAAGGAAAGGAAGAGAAPDFGSAIASALQQVNTQQAKASAAMPIADVIAIAGSARWTAGWRMNWVNGASRPPRTGAGRRFALPSSMGVRIWVSAMDYTGMFMMSR